jgi:hypothetical protein
MEFIQTIVTFGVNINFQDDLKTYLSSGTITIESAGEVNCEGGAPSQSGTQEASEESTEEATPAQSDTPEESTSPRGRIGRGRAAAQRAEVAASLSEEEAYNAIDRYMSARPQIFGQSYDIDLARISTTGPRLEEVIEGVERLKANNTYQSFPTSDLNIKISSLTNNEEGLPTAIVEYNSTFYETYPNGETKTFSSFLYSKPFHTFKLESGKWKIYKRD